MERFSGLLILFYRIKKTRNNSGTAKSNTKDQKITPAK